MSVRYIWNFGQLLRVDINQQDEGHDLEYRLKEIDELPNEASDYWLLSDEKKLRVDSLARSLSNASNSQGRYAKLSDFLVNERLFTILNRLVKETYK